MVSDVINRPRTVRGEAFPIDGETWPPMRYVDGGLVRLWRRQEGHDIDTAVMAVRHHPAGVKPTNCVVVVGLAAMHDLAATAML